MTIPESLHNVERLYVDSAPLIYLVEENETYLSSIRQVVILIENTPIDAVSSALTLVEVLVKPLRNGNSTLVREYCGVLVDSEDYTLMPVDSKIAIVAAELRARYSLRTPDSVHVATALQTGCDAILTNDADMKRIREIPIIFLDDLE